MLFLLKFSILIRICIHDTFVYLPLDFWSSFVMYAQPNNLFLFLTVRRFFGFCEYKEVCFSVHVILKVNFLVLYFCLSPLVPATFQNVSGAFVILQYFSLEL